MDPLSIAGSIAGLISLGDTIFRKLYHYAKHVKTAEDDINELKSEVAALNGTMHNVRLVAVELEADVESTYSIRTDYIAACLETMYSLDKKLGFVEVKKEDSKIRRAISRLAWPFKSSDTKALVTKLRHHREILSLALAADNMTTLLQCLSSQKNIAEVLQQACQNIKKREEIETRIALDDERRRMLGYFLKVDPQPNFQISIELRHPTTGFWLTEGETFCNWKNSCGSHLWLSGIPGAGKTVIAGLIIQSCLEAKSTGNFERAVAYFYCDYKRSETQKVVNLLSAVVSQLACQSESGFRQMKEYYSSLHPSHGIHRWPAKKELISLIKRMINNFDDVRIIIDGVDECAESAEEACDSLMSLASDHKKILSLAILSRDEPKIRNILEPICSHIEIEAQTQDVDLYVRTEIEKRVEKRRLRVRNPALKELIITKLVSKAQGMFRWVSCQLDYLCELSTDTQRRNALDQLPETLNETYERILLRIPKTSIPLARWTLYWTAYASSPLTIGALLDAVSISEESTFLDPDARPEEEDLFYCCSSLIRKANGFIELAHFSVQEYLQSIPETHPQLSQFRWNSAAEVSRCMACLSYLSLPEFDKPCLRTLDEFKQQNSKYPFYDHAVSFWSEYAETCWGAPPVADLSRKLFTPQKSIRLINLMTQRLFSSACAINFNYLEGPHYELKLARTMDLIVNSTFRPLHAAALLLLPEVCDWLCSLEVNINEISEIGTPLVVALFGWSSTTFGIEFDLSHNRNYESKVNTTANILIKARADLLAETPHSWTIAERLLRLPIECNGPFDKAMQLGMELDSGTLRYMRSLGEYAFAFILSKVSRPSDWKICPDTRDRVLQIALERPKTGLGLIKARLPISTSTDDQFFQCLKVCVQYDQVDALIGLTVDNRFAVNMTIPKFDGTILHYATASSSIGVMKMLSEMGCDPTKLNSLGQTAMFYLNHSASLDVIDHILSMGLLPTDTDSSGQTPLHAFFDKPQDIRLLKSAVFQKIATPDSVRLVDRYRSTLWFSFCSKYVPLILQSLLQYGIVTNRATTLQLCEYTTHLVDQGALEVSQRLSSLSGFELLVKNCLAKVNELDSRRWQISYGNNYDNGLSEAVSSIVLGVIERINVPQECKNRKQMNRLMRWAVENSDAQLWKALLTRWISLYFPDNSPESVLSSEDSHLILIERLGQVSQLLKQFNLARIDGFDALGRSLIHYLCDTAESSRWNNIVAQLEVVLKLSVSSTLPTASGEREQPLHFAAKHGNIAACELLVRYQADIEALTIGGWSPTSYAVRDADILFLQQLERRLGFSPWKNTQKIDLFNDGRVHICNFLHIAAYFGRVDVLTFLMEERKYFPSLETQDADGFTPLHFAAISGNLACVTWIVERGVNINTSTTKARWTSLHLALANDRLTVALYLIRVGAKLTYDITGETPDMLMKPEKRAEHLETIITALRETRTLLGDQSGLDLVRESAEPEEARHENITQKRSPLALCKECPSLAFAIQNIQWYKIEILLADGASLTYDSCRNNPSKGTLLGSILGMAVVKPDFNAYLPAFLEKLMAYENHWIWQGMSPFHIAAVWNPKAIPILARHILTHRNFYWKQMASALGIDTQSGTCPLQTLIHQPLDLKPLKTHYELLSGALPLHQAVWSNQILSISALLKLGARINALDPWRHSPLHHAARKGLTNVAKYLLKNGASPHIRDYKQQTAFMIACRSGSLDIVKLLNVFECGDTAVNYEGRNALHLSTKNSDIRVFIYLVNAGWDTSLRDRYGQTPLHLALEKDSLASFIFMKRIDLSPLTIDPDIGCKPFGNLSEGCYNKLLRALPKDCVRSILNLESPFLLSPLSRAARDVTLSGTKELRSLLKTGADLEYSNARYGTALMVACSSGCLESVKYLVRQGARLDIVMEGRPVNVLQVAGDQKIIDWFLVHRFTDQGKLAYDLKNQEQTPLNYWSGVRQLEIHLKGYYERKENQSLLEYAIYIHGMKEKWWKMVPLSWDATAHLI